MGSNRKKGYRREAKAKEVYENAGFATEKFVSERYGRTDGFGWVDFLAVRPDCVRFVQVKSGQASDVTKIAEWADEHAPENLHCDEVVWYDREGARLLECSTEHSRNRRVAVDERAEDCLMGEALTAYLSSEPADGE